MAEQLPKSLGLDNRVQVFNYSPNDVYLIKTKVGYASLIQLEDGEIIHDDGGLGMGQAESWNIAVKGNNIFFKPISLQPDTNLILVTNKRTYAFVLTTSDKQDNLTYVARFNYPVVQAKTIKPPQNKQKYFVKSHVVQGKDNKKYQIFMDSEFNKNYLYRGNPTLKPTNAWDDGRFTYLRYDHASDLPTVYRVLPDNSETLVNSHIDGNTMVIQEIGKIYRLRFGKVVGEVANQNKRLPKFNLTNTSVDGLVRENKGGE